MVASSIDTDGVNLDEDNERLYVTSRQEKVRYYDTSDWSHNPETDYITVSSGAIDIEVDVEKQYVYTSNLYSGTNLSKYDLTTGDPCTAETLINVESPVVGVTV